MGKACEPNKWFNNILLVPLLVAVIKTSRGSNAMEEGAKGFSRAEEA